MERGGSRYSAEVSDKTAADRRLEAKARFAAELLVRRASNPDVLVARGHFGQAFVDGEPERTIFKRLRELVDVIRADPHVARVWSHRAVDRIELYAVADALSGQSYPSRDDLISRLPLNERGDLVRAIRDEADATRFRTEIAPGQVWLRWDELAAQQAEIVRGLADEMRRRVKAPVDRRARIRLVDLAGEPDQPSPE